MVVLGGVLGAIVGLAIGILLADLALPSDASWDLVALALAVLGWLAGASALRTRRGRRTATPH